MKAAVQSKGQWGDFHSLIIRSLGWLRLSSEVDSIEVGSTGADEGLHSLSSRIGSDLFAEMASGLLAFGDRNALQELATCLAFLVI